MQVISCTPEQLSDTFNCIDGNAGDNIHTAQHIARECGILTDDCIAMEGPTFRAMPANDLLPLLPKLRVLARSSPEDKLTLVSAMSWHRYIIIIITRHSG